MIKTLISFFAVVTVAFATPMIYADVVDFEELTQFTGENPAGGGQFFNGNNGTGTNNAGWSSGGVFFNNNYTDAGSYDYWDGWSYSNVVNAASAGYTNQYASYPGGGFDGAGGVSAGGNYAISYGNGAFFNLPGASSLASVRLTNSTYAGLSMLNGDSFAKKFGGATGDDPDFFRVILTGFDGVDTTGNVIGSVSVNLADFTFADRADDYIVDEWIEVDLSALAVARSVQINYESSDMTNSGFINTPTYLAMDNLVLNSIPEPSAAILFTVLSGFGLALRRRNTIKRYTV
ncbi:MAG: DUF4465 domain-containing protein [Mariniblastus sp.]|nr:DUF4465 domain-containing protein [Mariniblastus sp.]